MFKTSAADILAGFLTMTKIQWLYDLVGTMLNQNYWDFGI